MLREKTACFTGHRNIDIINKFFIKKKLKQELKNLIKNGIIYFGNGGALGFDILAAVTVLELKEKHPQIKLIMVLPCKDQDKKWSAKDRQIYASVLKKADKKVYMFESYQSGCMHARNRHLIKNSSYCVAYLKESVGGTAYTVNNALENGLTIINIAEKQQKGV